MTNCNPVILFSLHIKT